MKRKFLITILFLVLYLIGKYFPLPGLGYGFLKINFKKMVLEGTILDFSIFTLGIGPYIMAHILFTILKPIVPFLSGLSEKKINKQIVLLAVIISLFFSHFKAHWIINLQIAKNENLILLSDNLFRLLTMLTTTIATIFIICIGKSITNKGIGAGFSCLVLVEILNTIIINFLRNKSIIMEEWGRFLIMIVSILFISLVIKHTIVVNKKILIQYRGKSSCIHLPLCLPGILPIYFASWVWLFPATIVGLLGQNSNLILDKIVSFTQKGSLLSYSLFSLLIFLFSLSLTSIIFDIKYFAKKFKKEEIFVQGLKSYELSMKYIDNALLKICLVWSIFLATIHSAFVLLPCWLKFPNLFSGKELILLIGIVFLFPKKNRFESVYNATNIRDLILTRAKLESEGITCYIINEEPLGKLLSLNIGFMAHAKIVINPAQEEKAIDILKNWIESDFK